MKYLLLATTLLFGASAFAHEGMKHKEKRTDSSYDSSKSYDSRRDTASERDARDSELAPPDKNARKMRMHEGTQGSVHPKVYTPGVDSEDTTIRE